MTTLMRWNPWEKLSAFERDAQRMVRSFLEPMERVAPVTVARRHDWVPACDVVTRGEDLVVRFELPGIDPEKDLELTVEDGVLCVKGERRFDDEDTGPGYYRREVARGAFERGVALPAGLEPGDITATYDNGILEVVLPKAAALTGATRIPIEVGGERKVIETKGQNKAG